jgi:hypothetical protein
MSTQTSISTALTDVPAVLKPYLTDPGGILPKAQTLIGKDYATTYGNDLAKADLAGSQRVASLAPMHLQMGSELEKMKTPDQFRAGTDALQSGIGALQGLTDADRTQAFMSPYIQNVLDVNKQEALRDSQKQLVGANLASARQGTYGGARNALMQSEANRNLQTQMGKIQAAGMQSAFEDARKSQLAQASGFGQIGSSLGAIGTAQNAADIDRIKTQGAYGDLQRSIQQTQLDTQYQDLMAKLNFPMTQLETMNNLVRGAPLAQTAASQRNTTPAPSFASQLAGMGLTGLSMYNMMK